MKTKYSGLNQKAIIRKLENDFQNAKANSPKEAKDRYVQAVVGIPEFNQAFERLSQHAMEPGTQVDRENLFSIAN